VASRGCSFRTLHAEVVRWTFDPLIDEPLEIEKGRVTVEFQAPKPSQAFLRILAREPAEFERLILKQKEATR